MSITNVRDALNGVIQGWTDAERAVAIQTLLKFPLGPKSFFAYCRAVPTVSLEYCIIDESQTKILLFPRPENDSFFSGQWHVSGSVQLPGENQNVVWYRLRMGDKYGLKNSILSSPVEIGTKDTQVGAQEDGNNPRGQERNVIHVVTHQGGSVGSGTWFTLGRLPDTLIGHHRKYLTEILIPWLSPNSIACN